MQLLDKPYKRTDYLEFLNDTFSFSKTLTAISIDSQAIKSFEQLGFITTTGLGIHPDFVEVAAFAYCPPNHAK